MKIKELLISIAISLGVGLLSTLITMNNQNIYDFINVPFFAPPGIVFPIVWTILYILMGISLYRVRVAKGDKTKKESGYRAFSLQLIFNFLWSILFFNLKAYTFSAIWLAAFIIFIILTIIYFINIDIVAAYLLVPYLVWCLFALYLNIGIAILN